MSCKRIIGGKTYNTETATLVAGGSDDHAVHFDELYQTRHGAYFRYSGHVDELVLKPLSPTEARVWMERHDMVDLIEKHFGEQPEAGAGESRFTLRMPDTLKNRIAGLTEEGQSLNAWIIRCLESCAARQAEKF